jgi:hypothetical protein
MIFNQNHGLESSLFVTAYLLQRPQLPLASWATLGPSVNDSGVLLRPYCEQRVRLELGDALCDVGGTRHLHPNERAVRVQGEQVEHVEQVTSCA